MSPQPTSASQVNRQQEAHVSSRRTDSSETPYDALARPRRKLNTHAAAAYSGLARSTLEKLRVFGGGPAYIKIGRRVVYDLTDLEEWLENHRRSSTSNSDAISTGQNLPNFRSSHKARASWRVEDKL